MKTLKKKRRIQILVIAALSLVIATGIIGYALRDGINLWKSPSQLLAELPDADAVFRIGGLVEPGSVLRDGENVQFRVTDNKATVPVTFTGILPDLFEEGQGMVGLGTFDGTTFAATEILAKHDEEYVPKEVTEALTN